MIKNNVGIIGGGRISRVHALTLARYQPQVKIKYVADPFITDEIRTWAKTAGIENVIADADKIFKDDEVDSVIICSPTSTHCGYIVKACAAGKNVYCEKPLGNDLSDIKKAMEAIKKSGIKFLMGFMRRFDDNHQKMHNAVASGEIGDPQIIKLLSRDPEPPPIEYAKSSGGYFFDSMIHDFDLARFYTGSEINEVYAIGNALVNPAISGFDIDTAICTLKFETGAIGVIDLSRKSNCGYDQRTEIHGSKGCVQMENIAEDAIVQRNEDGVKTSKPVYFFLERYEKSFANALQCFFSMVNDGKPAPVTEFDGLQAVRLAKAAQLSFDESRPVKLAEIH